MNKLILNAEGTLTRIVASVRDSQGNIKCITPNATVVNVLATGAVAIRIPTQNQTISVTAEGQVFIAFDPGSRQATAHAKQLNQARVLR